MNSATCRCTPSTTFGARVADGGHGDAGAEVDQGVAVDVDEDAATGGHDVHRQGGADAGGHGLRARACSSSCGAGDRGDERDAPGGAWDRRWSWRRRGSLVLPGAGARTTGYAVGGRHAIRACAGSGARSSQEHRIRRWRRCGGGVIRCSEGSELRWRGRRPVLSPPMQPVPAPSPLPFWIAGAPETSESVTKVIYPYDGCVVGRHAVPSLSRSSGPSPRPGPRATRRLPSRPRSVPRR